MNIDYSALISRSFRTVWQNRQFWLLGLIVALAAGGGNFNTSRNVGSSGGSTSFEQLFEQLLPLLVVAGFILVVLGIMLTFVSTIAQAGLIRAADQTERVGIAPSFGEAWRAGRPYMFRLWGLNFVLGLIIAVVLALAMIPIVFVILGAVSQAGRDRSDLTPFLGALAGIFGAIACLAALLIPVTIVVSLVRVYAQRVLVLEDSGIGVSLRAGWQILRQNVGVSLLTGLINVGISMLVGFVGMIVALMFSPAALLLFSLVEQGQIAGASVLLLVVGITLWLAMAVVQAIPTALFSVIWTNVFGIVRGRGAAQTAVPTYTTM